MNKKYLISFLIIFLLACNITSPFTAASPTPQVVFRSPRDMNLQPQDVPDLTETSVEEPATEPLLPEAIDQDQRAYISQTKDIYIESNAIMVPEQTKREPKEIIVEVVRKYRPEVEFDNYEQQVPVGDNGTIITINNFCSSDYSNGLVLIILRNNMVVVLIGCGPDISQDYILDLGEIIDGHITAPPQPYENDVISSEKDFLDEETDLDDSIEEGDNEIEESTDGFYTEEMRNVEGNHHYHEFGYISNEGAQSRSFAKEVQQDTREKFRDLEILFIENENGNPDFFCDFYFTGHPTYIKNNWERISKNIFINKFEEVSSADLTIEFTSNGFTLLQEWDDGAIITYVYTLEE